MGRFTHIQPSQERWNKHSVVRIHLPSSVNPSIAFPNKINSKTFGCQPFCSLMYIRIVINLENQSSHRVEATHKKVLDPFWELAGCMAILLGNKLSSKACKFHSSYSFCRFFKLVKPLVKRAKILSCGKPEKWGFPQCIQD